MSTGTIIGLVALVIIFGRTILRAVKLIVAIGIIAAFLLIGTLCGLFTIPFLS